MIDNTYELIGNLITWAKMKPPNIDAAWEGLYRAVKSTEIDLSRSVWQVKTDLLRSVSSRGRR